MLERLAARAAARAEARARDWQERLAERLGAAAPEGSSVAVEGEAVVLSGPGLARRRLVEPELRWRIEEALDGG